MFLRFGKRALSVSEFSVKMVSYKKNAKVIYPSAESNLISERQDSNENV